MKKHWQISDLQVVGHLARLPRNLRPRLVLPVYREEQASGAVIVIPLGEEVNGTFPRALEIALEEWDARVDAGEDTAFQQRVAAAAEHRLWVDEAGELH
jgi:hypothetical protein